MALEDDDLISIDALQKGVINNGTQTPAQLGVFMTQGVTDPVYSLPYQHTEQSRIFDLSGSGTTWSKKFQYPKQRLIFDVEMVSDGSAAAWTPASLAGYEIQTTGIDCCGMYLPTEPGIVTYGNNIYGLTVNTTVKDMWYTGEQYRLSGEGKIVFPVKLMFLSTAELRSDETVREITIKIVRKSTSNGVYLTSGMIQCNPLPSEEDIAFCS